MYSFKIKKYGISAGYDVISYNGEKITIKHDRFIEVKGTSGSKPIFFWSENKNMRKLLPDPMSYIMRSGTFKNTQKPSGKCNRKELEKVGIKWEDWQGKKQ